MIPLLPFTHHLFQSWWTNERSLTLSSIFLSLPQWYHSCRHPSFTLLFFHSSCTRSSHTISSGTIPRHLLFNTAATTYAGLITRGHVTKSRISYRPSYHLLYHSSFIIHHPFTITHIFLHSYNHLRHLHCKFIFPEASLIFIQQL